MTATVTSVKYPQVWSRKEAALTPLMSTSHGSSFSTHGRQYMSVVNDASSAIRTVLSFPIPGWDKSPFYPDVPVTHGFQAIGITSASHAPLGIINMIGAKASADHARDIGDSRGVTYSALDGATSLAQSAFGFDYGVFRAANIGQVVSPGSKTWADLSASAGFWGNILGGILYGFIALGELGKGIESLWFGYKLEKKKDKIAYVKQHFDVTPEALVEDEREKLRGKVFAIDEIGKIEREAQKILSKKAVETAEKEQCDLLKKNIEFMRDHGMCGKGFSLTKEELTAIVRERLSPQALDQHGRELLLNKLKARRVEKMTRRLGAEGVKELEKPMEKIELSKIEASASNTKWGHAKKFLIFGLAAAAFIVGCIFTGGGLALGIGIFLTLEFTWEMISSIQRARELRNDLTEAPGTRDEWVPKGQNALAISVAIAMIAFACVTGGWGALLIPLILTGLWITSNCAQLHFVRERREKYIDKLLEKDKLGLDEFSYILTYAKQHQIEEMLKNTKLMHKLSYADRKGIEKLREPPYFNETFEQTRERYQNAAAAWLLEGQKLALSDLQLKLQRRFGYERFQSAK